MCIRDSNGGMEGAPWVRGYAESGLLALADAGDVGLRHGDHKPQTGDVFDLDNRLCPGGSGSRANKRARMKVAQRDHSVKGGADHEIRLELRYATQRIICGPDVV